MAFEWKQNLSVGIADIDDQHKEPTKRLAGSYRHA